MIGSARCPGATECLIFTPHFDQASQTAVTKEHWITKGQVRQDQQPSPPAWLLKKHIKLEVPCAVFLQPNRLNRLNRPHGLHPQNLRRPRHRRRTRRWPGCASRGPHGLPRAAAGRDRPRQAGGHAVQPLDRRHGQGATGQGDRCPRRRDGEDHRPHRHPVPHPEHQERARRCTLPGPRTTSSATIWP